MNNALRRNLALLILILTTLSISSCGVNLSFGTTATPMPTYTSVPTYTPLPTYTPFPTYTPLPPTATIESERWDVKVISAEGAREYGTFYVEGEGLTRMIVLTIEYTYTGTGRAEFSPESAVLVYSGTIGFTGWSKTPILYQSEDTSQITDFSEESLVIRVDAGETRTDTFVWVFGADYTDFWLLFPESDAIDVSINE